MTPRIPKNIPKEGKVWRIWKECWDALRPYDSDPNVAILKIIKALEEQPATTAAPGQHPGCAFDEKKVQKIVKDSMEEVIRPFTGGG
jgi:hypothetical protein